MGILETAGWMLAIFYLGAVVASARCWLGIVRGRVRYAQLRDATGIGEATTLRRHFGLTTSDGCYRVTLAEVLRRRRASGIVLTDLPVHLLFLVSLGLTLGSPGSAGFVAVVVAAAAHALVLAVAACAILAGRRRAFAD